MKKIIFIALLLACLLPGASFGAGSITETFSDSAAPSNSSILTLAYVTDASGALSVATSATATASITGKMLYEVITTVTVSDVSPNNLYDVSINNTLGVDVMGGALIDRTSPGSQRAIPLLATSTYAPAMVTGTLTLVISGNTRALATGTIRLYFRR